MEHVESKHVNSPGIVCQHCDLVCVNRKGLRNHIYRYHKAWMYNIWWPVSIISPFMANKNCVEYLHFNKFLKHLRRWPNWSVGELKVT